MNNPDNEKHIDLYDKFLTQLQKHAPSEETVYEAIDKVKESLFIAEELTREEIDEVSQYLMRDLHDAAHYLAETGEELGSWLRFDIQLLETQLFELFMQVADKTQLELQDWQKHLTEQNQWKTGGIAGVGTLYCCQCGHIIHLKKTSRIPPCAACHNTLFERNTPSETE